MKKTRKILSLFLGVVLCLLPVGTAVASGNHNSRAGGVRDFANVVLFAYFQDSSKPDYFNQPSSKDGSMTSAQKIMEYYDGSSGRSFTNYMSAISYGQFKVHNVFPQYDKNTKKVSAIKLPFTTAQAQNGNIDYSVIKEIGNQNIPSGTETIDYDGDGMIDNLTIILLGEGSNTTGTLPTLYPHMNTYTGNTSVAGKQVYSYNMLNTDRILDSSLADGSGVICHEFLHTLGYPDLYTRDGSLPVYNWDMMGVSSKYVANPLAYLKMHFTGWVNIKTLDATQTGVEIDTSFENGGNQAYIIKSASNPYELFVVERREKGSPYDSDSLDAAIGGSGIIVYRVDTTVAGLSNYFGKNGIYIFRPQQGQNGFVSGNEKQTLNNAFLSKESGRTSIGSTDLNKGLEDGALTFSDGTNSGIVISNISNASGDKMTFDVTIPDASQYDMWEDTGFGKNENYESTALTEADGKKIAAGYNSGGTLQLYSYQNEKWESYGKPYSEKVGIWELKMFSLNNEIGVVYTDGNGTLHVIIFDGNSWKHVTTSNNLTGVNGFDVRESTNGEKAHLVYVQNNADLYYTEISSASISNGRKITNKSIVNPYVLVTDQGTFVAGREWGNQDRIGVFLLDEAQQSFNEISSPGNASAYDMVAYNNELYFAAGTTSELLVRKYDGNTWQDYASLNIDSYEPKMVVAQGNLYILTRPATSGAKDGLRAYAVADGKIHPEGEKIDTDGRNYSMTASKDTLFVGYSKDSKAYIKRKTTVNSLLSITITPPDKTSYLVGEAVSHDGMKVEANYVNGTRELKQGEYTVTGFDTTTVGDKIATVSFGGLSNTFAYSVFDNVTPKPTEIPEVTVTGLDAPKGGEKPDTEVTILETGIEKVEVSWTPADTTFEYGKTYQAKILVKAETGYVFSSGVKASVAGAEKVESKVTADGDLEVTAGYPAIAVPDITVNPTSVELKVGEKYEIKVTDETGSKLTWTSKDKSIATVDENGVVEGQSAGETFIVVENIYGKKAEIFVKVSEVSEGGNNDGDKEDGSSQKPESGNQQNSSQKPQSGTGQNQTISENSQPGKQNDKIVPTGDSSDMDRMTGLVLLSLLTIGGVVIVKRK